MKLKSIITTAIITISALLVTTTHAKNTSQELANEKLVISFYQQLFGDKDISSIDKFIATDYIQHNPAVADGAEAFKAAFTKWFAGAPKEKINIERSAAKGDIVFLHIRAKARPNNPQGAPRAIVDIFRVKNGKIVEHWDVIQDVPTTSANPHPMF